MAQAGRSTTSASRSHGSEPCDRRADQSLPADGDGALERNPALENLGIFGVRKVLLQARDLNPPTHERRPRKSARRDGPRRRAQLRQEVFPRWRRPTPSAIPLRLREMRLLRATTPARTAPTN